MPAAPPDKPLSVIVRFFPPGGGDEIIAGNYPLVRTCGYQALAPSRILDTRSSGGALSAGAVRRVLVTGVGGVPSAGVSAVVLNLTGTAPTASTYVTAYPAGASRPVASNLNLRQGQTAPNLAIVKVGAGGAVDLYNNAGSTHLVADVVGWIPEGSDYVGQTPSRLLDTRSAGGSIAGGTTVDVQVTGRASIPATGVGAVVVNLTGTGPTTSTFVTAYPTGAARPLASNLNLAAGDTSPNLAVVKVGAGGKISFYNNAGSTHLIADVVGWFPVGADYSGLTPARVLDTRTAGGPVQGGGNIDVRVTGRGGVPSSGVGAVVLNLTGVEPTTGTYVTAYPAGTTRPVASNLNLVKGETRPNLAVVKVGTGGNISVYNNAGSTHLIADVVGWFPDTVQPRGFVWGDNTDGDIGTGEPCTLESCGSTSPVRLPALAGALQVERGMANTYALRADGTVWAWGYNSQGQLGNGTICNEIGCGSSTPVQVSGLTDVIQIAAGYSTAYALRADHTVWAWGYSTYGELGNGTSCFTDLCPSTVPVKVTGLPPIWSIASGGRGGIADYGPSATYAIDYNSEVWVWGTNNGGTLGNGTVCTPATNPESCYSAVPIKIPNFNATNIATDGRNTYARRETATVWAWGQNYTPTPAQIPGLTDIADVEAGPANGYAITFDRTVWAWGDNSTGTLGNGTRCTPDANTSTCGTTTPQKIPGLTNVNQVSTDGLRGYTDPFGAHTFAIRSDGTVWAWGDNRNGRLGLGTAGTNCFPNYTLANHCYVPTPTQIPGLTRTTSVTAGWFGGYTTTEHRFRY